MPATAPIRPEVRNGVVVNAEETILGADNKAAVAAMVAAVEQVVTDGVDHSGIELVLTPMEEVGLRGAKQFDVCASAGRVRLLLRPRGADREHRHGRPHTAHVAPALHRPRGAFGYRPRAGPKCHRRRGARRRGHAAGPDRF